MRITIDERKTAYTGLRKDILSMILIGPSSPKCVLDVGCSNGVLLNFLRRNLGATYTVGIELDHDLAAEAAHLADRVIVCDLDCYDAGSMGECKFDLIIAADVLEHTKNPASVLREILKSASNNAQVVVSLPNIQHWTSIRNLLIGQWPQCERGLFDKSHLRCFTFRSIEDMMVGLNLEIEKVCRKYRITDRPDSRINRFSRLFAFWPLSPFFVYQYVLRFRYIKA